MCAKTRINIFGSFLDIWENVECPRFYWPNRYVGLNAQTFASIKHIKGIGLMLSPLEGINRWPWAGTLSLCLWTPRGHSPRPPLSRAGHVTPPRCCSHGPASEYHGCCRFWHSTSAYGIAEECAEIPASGHTVYRWPDDLLKPSLVIFLNVSEDQRCKRIVGRQLQITSEETQLAEDAQKRERYTFLIIFSLLR